MVRRRAFAVGLVVAAAVTAIAVDGSPARRADAAPAAPARPTDGLRRCRGVPGARCGSVTRPLDPSDPAAGTIDVHFELHPARRRADHPLGTIVAVEGGPGYTTTSSRDYYLDLFAPLASTPPAAARRQPRHRRVGGDRLPGAAVVRGRLRPQRANVRPPARRRRPTCGARRSRSTTWSPCSTTSASTGIDLYGDSYGTFFAQAFAVRHPDRVRTVVLDAAYPVDDQDPWYPDLNRAIAGRVPHRVRSRPGCRGARRRPDRAHAPAGRRAGRRPADRRGTRRRTATCSEVTVDAADAGLPGRVGDLRPPRVPRARRRRAGVPRRRRPAPAAADRVRAERARRRRAAWPSPRRACTSR